VKISFETFECTEHIHGGYLHKVIADISVEKEMLEKQNADNVFATLSTLSGEQYFFIGFKTQAVSLGIFLILIFFFLINNVLNIGYKAQISILKL